ncbi:DUF3152 domain-containing protein [Streptomyces sp. NPDC001985]|uniref:DUF3152 domain-containing protein n=1 Tax=Streptomyces sp. NPDC001985 TaxID=3154406 RepID=UPI00332DB0B6
MPRQPSRRAALPTRSALRRTRRRRRALVAAASVVVVSAGLGGAALLLAPDGAGSRALTGPAPTTSTAARPVPLPASPSGDTRPEPEPEPGSRTPKTVTPVPADGPGTFTPVRASGERHGRGPVRRFRVEIEDGVRLPGPATARAVSDILGHPRGWTRDSAYGFQLVESGPVDFTVKIATPGTTDRLCMVTTPASKGNVNCRVHHDVVVNLKLWVRGSPRFDGPPEAYRALIINHEVGHEIGRGHETCPGPGRPAPAMQQQIKGLLGCTSNAWPYDAEGNYVEGPSVP